MSLQIVNEMDMSCSTHLKDKKCIQTFVQKGGIRAMGRQ
jgi:hypothetical protein